MENKLIEATLNIHILEKCGEQGCYSQVYFARDPQTQGEIVVKVLKKSKLSTSYFSEAEILYSARHNNVVEIRCAAQDEDHVYLIMDKYQKGSIGSLLKSRNLTCRQCIKYAIDFLSGVHNIHTKKLVHFDIKPSNILISNSNSALISDFGLSKHLDAAGFASPDEVYGYHYPPEYFLSNDLTVLSDVYQSGITLYRMLNGIDVWKLQAASITVDNFEHKITKGQFPNRKYYIAHIPHKLRKIINKSINVDPNKRYQTALSLHNALSEHFDNIDWNYFKNGNSHLWQKDDNIRKEVFRIENCGDSFHTTYHKTILSTGRTQSISKGTKKNISGNDIVKFCEEILLGG